ncbi:MAG: [protein-PII] uridylyltransferase [Acidimicrobiales bacterium]
MPSDPDSAPSPATTSGWAVRLTERRARVLDGDGRGRPLCRALSEATDEVLAGLFADAAAGSVRGVALVAVGGYGRRELAPDSDLDLWLLHDGRGDVATVAERLWYPIWDAGLKLGHAVRTPRQALALASDDLETATAALSTRLVAGDAALAEDVAASALAQWRKRSGRWLADLSAGVGRRHRSAGEVAFLLEPDVKEGRGGLRDVHSLRWTHLARPVLLDGDDEALTAAEETLLEVRVALHLLLGGRPGDQLLLERQDEVAAALGDTSADDLMARVAAAARSVAWTGDEVWGRVSSSLTGPFGRIFARDRPLGPGIVLRDGEVHVEADADVGGDGSLVLRAAAAAARAGTRIDRQSLDRLAAVAPLLDGPWPPGARQALVELLGTGHAAVPVLEAIDQRRLLERVLPEWSHTRSRPQRNAIHRFTVDRHLCEAAANAAALADTVARPDLLLIGAWLHDIGKGLPGDHTVVGMELLAGIAERMGYAPDDVAVLVDLVRHHLLLPDVATRRDLSDDDVIDGVAEAVGSLGTLELLAALTEADAVATGPAAWGPWKAELVAALVDRVAHVLRGGVAGEVTGERFPGVDIAALLAAGTSAVRGEGHRLTVVAPDRPGLFSRVAGTLALANLTVVGADAASATSDGGAPMAASCFRVAPGAGPVDWDAVATDVRSAIAGRIALDARLAQRARNHRRPSAVRRLAAPPHVRVDNTASGTATVVEVRALDGIGVLYRITRALADLDLDITVAKVSTLGTEVIDAFYVRTASGAKLTDRDHMRELERAVLHQLSLA